MVLQNPRHSHGIVTRWHKKLKRTINLIYRRQGRTEDLQDWLKLLLDRFEAYRKKMYYMANKRELAREEGGYVQFLDAAKALHVNKLHFTDAPLINFKTYYKFVHMQRNAESHTAPVIDDTHVLPGIHMATAMYLYATMIYITDMESEEDVPIDLDYKDLNTRNTMVANPDDD